MSGATKSCGCLRTKKTYCEWHDMVDSRLYRTWGNMVNRCTNPNNPAYKNYGERGIGVCDEWMSFPSFKNWAESNGYADNLTLDRQDNDNGYSPNNCRWVDNFVQANNKRSNRALTLNEETHTIAEWADKLNVSYKALHRRVSLGWSDERALTQPYRKSPSKNNNIHNS